jgi:hypothetical protein
MSVCASGRLLRTDVTAQPVHPVRDALLGAALHRWRHVCGCLARRSVLRSVRDTEADADVAAWVYVCTMDPVAAQGVLVPESSWAAFLRRTGEVPVLLSESRRVVSLAARSDCRDDPERHCRRMRVTTGKPGKQRQRAACECVSKTIDVSEANEGQRISARKR